MRNRLEAIIDWIVWAEYLERLGRPWSVLLVPFAFLFLAVTMPLWFPVAVLCAIWETFED